MPVSSKRKKTQKKVTASKAPKSVKPMKPTPTSEYIDDFLDDVIISLENDNVALVSVLKEVAGNLNHPKAFKHYYVMSRDENGKLLEHNEGPVFKRRFVNALENAEDSDPDPVKVVIGYFTRDQVKIKNNGLDFLTPNFAVQWKILGRKFVPDSSEYNWNGYMVQPGGGVSRSF